MSEAATLPPSEEVAERARAVLEANWHPAGYTTPHAATYPFGWLWDSCFHAVAWAELGRADRAVTELAHVFRTQGPSGFVPHVDYEVAPDHHAGFWGRSGSSSITQPPMYGHAVAELIRRGIEVPGAVVEAAERGLRFLLETRARDPATELVTVVHPWETGADDSPRWDHWCPGGFDLARWYEVKGALVATVATDPHGAPVANPAFGAAPAGFNALVAFNAAELAEVTGDAGLRAAAGALADALARRWDPTPRTWVDAGPAADTSGRVRTLDALLPALVDAERAGPALADALDDRAYGGSCGPAGVHRDEPCFAPHTYWRGPAWPQLTYLLWVAARRHGRAPAADGLAERLVRGAVASGMAEYWDPDDGHGLGAVPQSWAALAAVVRPVPGRGPGRPAPTAAR